VKKEGFIRNIVFGVEDGLVSTLGFVSGIAAINIGNDILLLTGVVLIVAEAFSMAAGSFLTAESVRDLTSKRHGSHSGPLIGAVIMFVAYIGAGTLVISPYFVAWPGPALGISIAISLTALFVLGIVIARVARVPVLARGIRAVLVGGAAIGIGIFVARLVMNALS
jgi:VIT1/CCC1 family predicted Fe2+/Mn2+ transporter